MQQPSSIMPQSSARCSSRLCAALLACCLTVADSLPIACAAETTSPLLSSGQFVQLIRPALSLQQIRLIGGSGKVTRAADFVDVPKDAWYFQELDLMVSSQRIQGYPNNRFAPNAPMTVQEYIKILVGGILTGQQLRAYDTGSSNWAEKYVKAGNALGILKGFDCSPERLKRAITRGEAAWLLAAFARYKNEPLAVPTGIERALRDYNEISDTYREAVGLAFSAGLVTGYTDGCYHANDSMRRCEAVITTLRFLDTGHRVKVVIPPYDYAAPVPESAPVDDSFFADAAFFGNSQMDGFGAYSGLQYGTFLGATSVSVYNAWEDNRKAIFQERQFGKIYILLGINEIGYGIAAVAKKYGELVQEFQRLQPNAAIYVLSELPVCESKLTDMERRYQVSNASVRALNAELQKMCAERQVYFVNIYEAFVDDSGGLPASKCWDACHMNVAPHKDWLAYLKTHTV